MLHYRLWDVDVLINKAMVYGLLTGTLIAVYAALIARKPQSLTHVEAAALPLAAGTAYEMII